MGQDTVSVLKRGGSLPTTVTANCGRSRTSILPHRGKISRTFNDIKLTILCGFVTILVLRGYIGLNLTSSDADAVNQNLIEESNRFLVEICSDKDPSDPRIVWIPNSTLTPPTLSAPKYPIGTRSARSGSIGMLIFPATSPG